MRFWRDAALADSSTATRIHRKPSLDFSLTGLVYCSMMMFMGLAALNSSANLLFGVFGLMIGVLLMSWGIGRIVLRRLTLHRVLPELAVVGQTTAVVYEFSNKKRFWPTLSVMIAELDGTEAFVHQLHAYLLHAASGMTASVPTEGIPKRRGLHQMDRYQISTSFPFGFIKRAVVHQQKDTMLVYPALGQVDPKVLAMCRSADSSGAIMRPKPGGNDEFYGVKEYRKGNNPRLIYWRRSARTGVLVTKEMTQVSPPRLTILVDTHCPLRTVDAHAEVERGIAMAASLASQALEAGLSVGLIAWTGEDFASMAPARGKRHRRDLLAQLARLPLNTEHNTSELLGASRTMAEVGSTPVLITPGEVQVSLSDHLRSGLVSFTTSSPQARRWFRFADTVDFQRCMPTEQEPRVEAKRKVAKKRPADRAAAGG
ncbi:MAG TPA: DUF58 domain-containing protein [Tepidisphaeraceae bacterium]|jgi:uncharacterized protein (DUF58 family)